MILVVKSRVILFKQLTTDTICDKHTFSSVVRFDNIQVIFLFDIRVYHWKCISDFTRRTSQTEIVCLKQPINKISSSVFFCALYGTQQFLCESSKQLYQSDSDIAKLEHCVIIQNGNIRDMQHIQQKIMSYSLHFTSYVVISSLNTEALLNS